jgi:hypothetical protein
MSKCWTWTGAINSSGYGHAWSAGKMVAVHRVAYETLVGPIPAGLDIDHLCRNRACYNPTHLEPVTRQENARRGAVLITHCPAGHAYEGANLYVDPEGHRRCRDCRNTKKRASRAGGGQPGTPAQTEQ